MDKLQDQLKATLEKTGIPAKEIHCYGNQIMITCWSEGAAAKYASVLHRFCSKVRPVLKTIDENVKNKKTVLNPSVHDVWRVWGTI